MYDGAMSGVETHLDSWIGFLYCKNIKILHPEIETRGRSNRIIEENLGGSIDIDGCY